mgnify:CR=1 FL=1
METEITKKLFTVGDYHRMARTGILREDDRLELIDGEVIEMSPIGHRHFVCVGRMVTLFRRPFGDKVFVSIQGPLRLNEWTEVQPDVVLFKPRSDFYAAKIPNAADVLLVVEVSDTTLATDQKVKLPKYASAGIAEYWIADLQHDLLHVYRHLQGQAYTTILTLRPGDSVSLLSSPDVEFRVDELLTTDLETLADAP